MFSPRDLHVIILAGDDNPRLIPLSTAVSGLPLPKQFALIVGDGSLLQQTVAPYANVVSPDRIAVVVSTAHEDLARTQLRQWKGINILSRPINHGPAVDMLLALGRVLARDPDAKVVVAPAHHYVPGASVLVSSLVTAALGLGNTPVILAGAAINGVRASDHSIVPGPRRDGRVFSIKRVVASASPAQLKRLRAEGALWDTSAFTGAAARVWKMLAEKLPTEAATIESLWAEDSTVLTSVGSAFRYMPEVAFGGIWWQGCKDIGVVPVSGSGWNAWNSPEQVMDSLSDPHDLESVLARIYQRQQGIDRAQLRRRFRAEARLRRMTAVCPLR
jgi:mannose-1-phosphate guanylyltransferase